jgi:hypothetical protein
MDEDQEIALSVGSLKAGTTSGDRYGLLRISRKRHWRLLRRRRQLRQNFVRRIVTARDATRAPSSMPQWQQPPALQQHRLEKMLERQRPRPHRGTRALPAVPRPHPSRSTATTQPSGRQAHPGKTTSARSSPTLANPKRSTLRRRLMSAPQARQSSTLGGRPHDPSSYPRHARRRDRGRSQ